MSYRNDDTPKEFEVYRGKIVKIEEYGAFVEIEGFRNHGLVHISQLSATRVESPKDVVSAGESVYVKVLSVDGEPGRKPKIALSMKYCDQTTGEDKDRNSIEYEQENRKRRPRASDTTPLELGAVYNTQCSRCGGRGHISSECFNTGDKHYELLPEEDEGIRSISRERDLGDGNRGGGMGRGRGRPLPSTQRHVGTAAVGRGRAATLPAWMTDDSTLALRGAGTVTNEGRGRGRNEDHSRSRSKSSSSRSSSEDRGDKKKKHHHHSKKKSKSKKEKKEKKSKKSKKERRHGRERGHSEERVSNSRGTRQKERSWSPSRSFSRSRERIRYADKDRAGRSTGRDRSGYRDRSRSRERRRSREEGGARGRHGDERRFSRSESRQRSYRYEDLSEERYKRHRGR